MVEVSHLVKKYGEKIALNDVSFRVGRGEVVGLLGPNGAGKSTAMNIVTGYLSATSGDAVILGHNILDEPQAAQKLIGYLPEHPPLYLDMTVREYLDFIYDLKKIKVQKRAHIDEVCEVTGIADVSRRVIGHLSKGYRQRVGLAQAILGGPEVLILDEPTVGLDPKQIIEIRGLIKGLGKRHTVILSSHILSEVQAVCDRVVVIDRGKIVADDTPSNLSKALSGDHKLLVRVEGPDREVQKLLLALPHIESVTPMGERERGVYEYAVEAGAGADVRRELFSRLAQRNWPLLGLRSSELTLEDIFLQLVAEEGKS